MVERLSTGIEGLDEKMEGGFVKGSINLVVGKTGTGKTQFCCSFIHAGTQMGEAGVYATTEERAKDIKEDMRVMFGWNLEELEERGLVKFITLKPLFPEKAVESDIPRLTKSYIFNIYDTLSRAVREMNAKRLVIDSISVLEMFIHDKYLARVAIMNLIELLRELGVTTLMAGEIPETQEGLSGAGIIEYLVDCVIKLDFVPVAEEFKRTLTIRKMRRTNHSTLIHPFEITSEGWRIIELE